MKKAVLRIFSTFLIVVLTVTLYYILCLVSTNSVYNHVKKVVSREIIINDTNDPLYCYSDDTGIISGTAYSKCDFKRQYVFHNFKSGSMSIVFSEDIYNEKDELIHQYKNLQIIVYIEKQNGKWVVTNINHII